MSEFRIEIHLCFSCNNKQDLKRGEIRILYIHIKYILKYIRILKYTTHKIINIIMNIILKSNEHNLFKMSLITYIFFLNNIYILVII